MALTLLKEDSGRRLTPSEIESIPSKLLPIALQLNHLLQEFTNLSLSLFSSLSSASVIPTQQTYSAIAALDVKLAGVVQLAVEHQRLQLQIEQVTAELHKTEHAWRRGTRALHDVINELEPIVASGKLDREAIEASDPSKGILTPSTILSYGRLLAPFTSAPPSSLFPPEKRDEPGTMDPSGRGLPPGAFPPFPTEATMRRGRLQFGSDGMEALGETEEVGGEFILYLSHSSLTSRLT